MTTPAASAPLDAISQFNLIYTQTAALAGRPGFDVFQHLYVAEQGNMAPLTLKIEDRDHLRDGRIKQIARDLLKEARNEMGLNNTLTQAQKAQLSEQFTTFESWLPPPSYAQATTRPREGDDWRRTDLEAARASIEKPSVKKEFLNSDLLVGISSAGGSMVLFAAFFGAALLTIGLAASVASMGIAGGAILGAGLLGAGIIVGIFGVYHLVQKAKYSAKIERLVQAQSYTKQELKEHWGELPPLAKIVCLTSMEPQFRRRISELHPELAEFCSKIDEMDLPPDTELLLLALNTCPQTWDFSDTMDYLYVKDSEALRRVSPEASPALQAAIEACLQRHA